MKNKTTVGIDIGSEAIRIMVAETIRGENSPRVLSLTNKRSSGVRHGYINNIDDVKQNIRDAVKDAERASGKKIQEILLAIGGISLESILCEGSIAVSKADLEIGELDIKRAIEASESNLKKLVNRQIVQSVPIQYKLDGKKVFGRPNGLKGEILEVKTLYITCGEQHLNDIMSAIEDLGIIVRNVIPSPIAASLGILSKIQKTAGCILADIGAETVSVVIFEEGLPISLKVFPIGGSDITNDIALGFKISIEEAEEIKKRGGGELKGNSKRKLEEIIEARLSDIFETIESHLKKLGKNGLLPAGIILTGGGANINQISEMAKHYLNIPARIADASALFTIPVNSLKENQSVSKKLDPSWITVYGLCNFDHAEENEEFSGSHFVKQTKNNLAKWLRQFLP